MFADVQSGPLSGPSWRVEPARSHTCSEHPVADRHDDAGLFGDPDELAGATSPRTGCSQRRSASSATRSPDRRSNCGWNTHAQLVALERLAESALGEQPGDGLRVHRLVEQLAARTAAALGAVHRGVGVAQQAGGAISRAARHRDAEAGGHDDLRVASVNG